VDLQRLQQQVLSLQQDISTSNERRAAAEKAQQGNKAFLQVKQAQQMATVVARKREEIQAKLDRLQVCWGCCVQEIVHNLRL
jgi:intraflagellar transport protein 81